MLCDEVKWVKRNTLRWFGHIESKEFVKKVYASEIVSHRRRVRLVVRWKDRMKAYMNETVADREG